MPGTHQSFTPATTVTLRAAGQAATTVALPALDAGNPAVLLQNAGVGPVWVFAGSAQGGSITGATGVIRLEEGQVRLLPADALGASAVAAIQSSTGGGVLQFSRGAVTPVWLFPAAMSVVI